MNCHRRLVTWSPAYPCLIRIQPEQELLSPWYFTILASSPVIQAFAKAVGRPLVFLSNTTLHRTCGYTDEHFAYVVPSLPFTEQTAIVRFLDHADRRIRRYIRAKQKLIALLEEQKQAIIHQAVTGQIDVRTGQPYPAYKASGRGVAGGRAEHWGTSSSSRMPL